MYRLLACDIDDTILAPDGSIPEANHRALERLHARGIAVVFSSGRATVSLRGIATRIIEPADDEYLISFNGARITSVLSGTVLSEQLLMPPVIETVLRYCREHQLLVHGFPGGRFLAERSNEDNLERSRRYAAGTRMDWELVPDLAAAMPGGSAKLLIIGDPDELPTHRERLLALAGPRVDITTSKPVFLELVPQGVSKGAALTRLAAHLGIAIEETVAVGDSLNDAEMIRTAGRGVAVANARDELKAIADVVLDRRAEDGAIAELAERFFPEER